MWLDLEIAKSFSGRIRLTEDLFMFESNPKWRNVSGSVRWREFTVVKDASGAQVSPEAVRYYFNLFKVGIKAKLNSWFHLDQDTLFAGLTMTGFQLILLSFQV